MAKNAGKASSKKPRKRSPTGSPIPTLRDAQLAADRVRFLPPPKHPLVRWHRLNHYGYLAGIAHQAGDITTARRLRQWCDKTAGYTADAHRRLQDYIQGDDG